MEEISLIDVSLADDDLLLPSSVDGFLRSIDSQALEHCDGSYNDANATLNTKNLDKDGTQTEQTYMPSDLLEPERGASRKYNLRKSLAWDSAFFTNEGVLDQEELATVNSTFTKAKSCALPEIQEDVRKSVDSNATFDSDSCTIESLEVDLFENSQASIRRSNNKCKKASKKVEFACQNKMKPTATSIGNDARQMKKKPSKEVVLPRVAYIGDEERRASLRPPQIASRVLAPNRRISTPGSIPGKDKPHKATAGSSGSCQSIVPSKKVTTAREPYAAIPRPSSTAKISCASSTSDKMLTNASSTHIKSKSCTSDVKVARKKIDSINIDKSTVKVANKLPLKVSKGRDEPKNVHNTKAYQIPSSKLSNGSPRKSLDTVASESSSSSVRASSDSEVTSNLQKLQLNNSVDITGKSSRMLQSRHANEPSSGFSILSDSLATNGSRNQPSNVSRMTGLKPSGLRLPSPKFGYFDVDKSAACNSASSEKSIQTAAYRSTSGTGNSGRLIKLMPSKVKSPIQVSRSSTVLVMTSIPSPKTTNMQRIIETSHEVSLNNQNNLSSVNGKQAHPICEYEAEVSDAVVSEFDAKDSSQNQLHSIAIKTSLEDNGHGISSKRECDVHQEEKCTQTASLVGEVSSTSQSQAVSCNTRRHLETSLLSAPKSNDKENLLPSGDEIFLMCRKPETCDLKDTAALLVEKRPSPLEISNADANVLVNTED